MFININIYTIYTMSYETKEITLTEQEIGAMF